MMPGFDLVLGLPRVDDGALRQWDNLLAEPAPPEGFAYAKAVGTARAASPTPPRVSSSSAKVERDSMTALGVRIPDDANEVTTPRTACSTWRRTCPTPRWRRSAATTKPSAAGVREGRPARGRAALRRAVGLVLPGAPPLWCVPARDRSGGAGREGVSRRPGAQSGKRLGAEWSRDEPQGAEEGQRRRPVEARAAKAWKNADTKIASSRL